MLRRPRLNGVRFSSRRPRDASRLRPAEGEANNGCHRSDSRSRAPAKRPGRRLALAVLLPVGPLAVAILRGILPYYTNDSNSVLAAKVAAHQGAEAAVLWLAVIAALTLIPAVITAGMLARRGAPRLGTTGLVLSFAGLMFLYSPSIAGPDTVALGAARIGIAPAATGRLLSSIGALGPVSFGSDVFVAGHVIGLILLGIALWRAGVVPGWAGLAIAVSQVGHVVFAIGVPNHLLDGCSWALTAVGFAAVAVALVRQPAAAGQAAVAGPAA